ncbi:META and DUF4377 domain-containing protein [Ottowia oryzae]|uniref:Heat-shock protein n=1 Tax=Ottowia oryzae TaxID=2109914 RepID=A0A2S0MHE8_9BURK|nr:META and DUF4377 domain-containing protein [Ottowia oryzae]AVO35300.1 heat-shock protein [Ottowia oryzae]
MNPTHRLAARLTPLVACVGLLAACGQSATAPTANGGASPATTSISTTHVTTPPAQPSPQAVALSAARVLPAYEWELTAARDGRGQNDARWRVGDRPPLRLSFKDGRVAVHHLCNLASAGYELDGTQMRMTRPTATLRACAELGLMALESRVLSLLPTVQAAHASGAPDAPQLLLRFADGSEWDLVGHPTPETRYGSAGERLFLEVAPLKVACNHPLMPNATCLRVRDVRYGENGVKTGEGEWRIFQGSIEGYEHREGTRNILRVNRYSLARNGQLPADAPSHAYVLDMVVESELTQ